MTLARTLLAAATVLALAAAPTWAADVTPFKNDALYKAFHGMAGVDRVTDTMVDLSLADPRVADIFKGQDIAHLRQMLKEHLCYVLGGPCAYTGKSMKEAHKDLGIEQTDFNAVVENLQKAMDKEGVPFRDQNRLLAKLAPLERDIVVRSGEPRLFHR